MTYVLLVAGLIALLWALAALAINAKSSTLAGILGPFASHAAGRSKPAFKPGSAVESTYLRMTLDHRSGAMAGTVRRGRFAGYDLDGLDLGDLLALLAELQQDDADGARLLTAWLDRSEHASTWREAAQSGRGRQAEPSSGMSRQQAADILGVAADADEASIKAAHHRLMAANHPDKGGSPWLARQINLARDTLLKVP